MKVYFNPGCIVPCSQHCGNAVRTFKVYAGPYADFKCARCAPWLEYNEKQIRGCYTKCNFCEAQYKVMEVRYPSLCHVCRSK